MRAWSPFWVDRRRTNLSGPDGRRLDVFDHGARAGATGFAASQWLRATSLKIVVGYFGKIESFVGCQMFERRSPDSNKRRCKICRGKGKIWSKVAQEYTCQDCLGQGMYRDNRMVMQHCGCSGGKRYRGDWINCKPCGGTGWMDPNAKTSFDAGGGTEKPTPPLSPGGWLTPVGAIAGAVIGAGWIADRDMILLGMIAGLFAGAFVTNTLIGILGKWATPIGLILIAGFVYSLL